MLARVENGRAKTLAENSPVNIAALVDFIEYTLDDIKGSISEDTAAHGVEKVIFKKLSHKGENKRGQLTATLELWEYIPQTITAKSGSSSGSSSGSGKSGGGAASNLKADYKSYLSNERGKSPARDDADATAAMNKVTAMPY